MQRVIVLVCLLFCSVASAQTTRPATIIVGVFSQPISSFDKWSGRGVNTLVAAESEGGRVNLEAWATAAASKGFKTIRQPSTRPGFDAGDASLIAYLLPDEPDGHGTPAADLAAIRAAFPRRDLPVFLNLAGDHLYDVPASVQQHQAYAACADWLSADWYPCNRNKPISFIAKELDFLDRVGPGKPRLAMIETSNQELYTTSRSPTPDELEAEVMHAMLHGAAGVIYFPQNPTHWSFDATAPSVAQRMTEVNGRLAAWSSGAIAPPTTQTAQPSSLPTPQPSGQPSALPTSQPASQPTLADLIKALQDNTTAVQAVKAAVDKLSAEQARPKMIVTQPN